MKAMIMRLLDVSLVKAAMKEIMEDKQALDFDRQRAARLFSLFDQLDAEWDYELKTIKRVDEEEDGWIDGVVESRDYETPQLIDPDTDKE